MPADLSSVHANRALASLSVLLNSDQDTFLLNRMCARRPVENLSDIYFEHGREGAYKSDTAGQSDKRFLPSLTAAGAPAAVVEHTLAQRTYVAHRYALKELVTDQEIQKSDDPLQPIKDAATMLAMRIRNDAEQICANVTARYAAYPAGNRTQLTTGANGTSWNKASAAGTASEPLTDIRVGRIVVERSIQRPANTLVLSALTKYHLNDHDDFKGILQYTDGSYLEGEGIPEVLRGLKLVVGKAVANISKDGAAYSGDYLYGDQDEATAANQPCAIICYVPESRTIGVRGFSSFIWFDVRDETTKTFGVSTRTWRDDDRRGWFVEAAQTLDVRSGISNSTPAITGAYCISRAAIP